MTLPQWERPCWWRDRGTPADRAVRRLYRLGVKQLRHYGILGLLVPARVDPDTGYRYYRLETRLMIRLDDAG
ncbi:hypothetical protein Acsp04_48600 [Actinomadura sp. NBRC 104425]|uniref:hypothetical protein n=1 Tax=Actinomadura sp. NBRC 104425 TaxID=3032204 RepID=UPI0024A4BEE6|nr:hypothetical protein [Actinomadura sp. NBRC 104425]GLZ14625.1 hypothetical protein Acsp04_48600 [Actinomadura sp. NBRC 104425]